MPDKPSALSRRTLLAVGAAGAAGLSGCALNNPFSDAKTPAAEAVRDLAPDVAVAVQAVTLITGVKAHLDATVATYPALGDRLGPFAAAHTAHLTALVDAVPDRVDTSVQGEITTVPDNRAAARDAVLKHEKQVRDGLVGLAMRAESGAFARLLGSMAAAISQRLAAPLATRLT